MGQDLGNERLWRLVDVGPEAGRAGEEKACTEFPWLWRMAMAALKFLALVSCVQYVNRIKLPDHSWFGTLG